MKIHSDTLTVQDIRSAVPSGCYLTDPGEKFQGLTNVGFEGSRKRARGYVVRLCGSSKYAPQNRPGEKAATWDEWGIFIANIYAVDPDAICGWYSSLGDFIEKTTQEHDRIKTYRRDLLPTHSAPWLAQRSGGDDETLAEELGRLRRELSEHHYDTPEHRMILDRIAVLVREAAVARRQK